MSRIMRRLESGERWWAAEIALRSFGLASLGSCAGVAAWLFGSVQQPPPHGFSVLEILSALTVFLGWSLGWAFLVEGPGLFKLIPVPARHRRFNP